MEGRGETVLQYSSFEVSRYLVSEGRRFPFFGLVRLTL